MERILKKSIRAVSLSLAFLSVVAIAAIASERHGGALQTALADIPYSTPADSGGGGDSGGGSGDCGDSGGDGCGM